MGTILFIIGIILLILGAAAIVLTGFAAWFVYGPLIIVGIILIRKGRKK